MKIHTLLSPLNVEELYFTKKTTVVIDVLRATTTIVTALANEAKEIIPVGSIEFAMKASGDSFGGHTLLGGERNTKKIEGFTLGNSPLEYSKELIKGKSIVLFTTNGSKAIVKAKFSSQLYIVSFLNSKTIAEKLVSESDEVEILCSGNNGLFSYEDSVCAGNLIADINSLSNKNDLDDASKTCLLLHQQHESNTNKMLKNTEHGKKLLENGYINDIEFASQKDIFNIIPIFYKGSIQIL